ncbi:MULTISPECIES: hypothetical protein [Brucella/Ochrobactrum group]|jgi:hypothetical protein|uniref:DUF3800 domain-containing protein n=1 Tax=Brucella pseudintermedia TaxID=370111 RepID=A0ABY5U767_9HYPH|nr:MULTISPECIES: hypothetical protein [Brucella/Ochrobactrum group]KAB2685572.1 hypothetical protein F9K78_02340 [Brucella pseudintermedia]NKE76554.1 hypothetical protein [Ochrobactrum sp. MC-1LL]TWH04154.1 hypothetical protein L614_001000001780 [Ochrobactrum sp. J50]UWL59181.1 hypothetical protein NIK97_06385 [Brucella pseudintermedia]WPM79571.1 hypothetical protein R5W60_10270 [Brucella pseudintermedia]
MPNFGISSFLKILHLNEKPQKTEIRGRLEPKTGGGYDFHGSVRRLCTEIALNDGDPALVIGHIKDIKKAAERNSARLGLQAFLEWRKHNLSEVSTATNVTYQSPKDLFKVTFKPNFSMIDSNGVTAVHIWNTAKPKLDDHFVRATLSIFPELYTENKPDDLAVLCLRSQRLIRLGQPDAKLQALGNILINKIERIISEINEGGDRKPRDIGEHPTPPRFH